MSAATRPAGPRLLRRGAGVMLVAEAVALVLVAGAQDPAVRPVTAALGGNPRHLVSPVEVGVALAVVVALLGVGRLVPSRLAPWIDPLLTTPIAVFVVAQLNGVEDVGALVGIYALASGGVLFGMVQGDGDRRGVGDRVGGFGSTRGSRRALGFGAAVGIVPWGIVAFQQVGAGATGSPVGGDVVLITLVTLAFAFAEFVATWRRAEVPAAWLRILGLSAVAWLVVALI